MLTKANGHARPQPRVPAESYRPLTPEDLERHEAVTVALQCKAAGLGRPSLLARIVESPIGGLLFIALLGACLIFWGAGLGW